MIYILGRMGHHKRALDLILTQMQDLPHAIQFVQENDESLWDYLIDLSLTSKENVEQLLQFAAQHKIDPIKLIRKVRRVTSALASLPINSLLVRVFRSRRTWRSTTSSRSSSTSSRTTASRCVTVSGLRSAPWSCSPAL